jgi:RNA polymerase sigma-70 factor (ECF subfamily)
MTSTELPARTLQRAQRGDRSAQGELVELYQERVYALVSRMMAGRGPELVDDLAQESLVRVLQAVECFDPRGTAKLSTWILTIATRVCIDALRRPRLLRPLPAEEPASDGVDPETLARVRQRLRRVVEAAERLTPDQRAVLILRAYHEFDYEEIARALGIGLAAVKSRLNRARQVLRDVLEQADLPPARHAPEDGSSAEPRS